jgi:aspartyl-tRNA(Asn)/glutamyl-tRNA(Gln) amidotransferase subunit C
MNPREVEHIALLARIALTPEERDRMGEELGKVLDYVRALDALGLEHDPPLSHVLDGFAAAREDIARPTECLDRDELLAQAPEAEGPYFVVPTVVDTRG